MIANEEILGQLLDNYLDEIVIVYLPIISPVVKVGP